MNYDRVTHVDICVENMRVRKPLFMKLLPYVRGYREYHCDVVTYATVDGERQQVDTKKAIFGGDGTMTIAVDVPFTLEVKGDG